MKIKIRRYLIQEGVIDFVKNNWGKGVLAAGGLMMANAGVFGPTAQKAVESGGAAMNKFLNDAGDWSKEAVDKLDNKYNNPHNQQNMQNTQNNETNHSNNLQNQTKPNVNSNDTHPNINQQKMQNQNQNDNKVDTKVENKIDNSSNQEG